jgi:Zn-dependent protease
MRDLMSWSVPIGRIFGITIRLHVFLYLLFVVMMVGRGIAKGYGWEATQIQLLLFVAVLLHEFGHCFAAREVGGDASDIVMWPLGGLAYVDIPHSPRAHFVTVVWGPLVNLLLCCAVGLALVSAAGLLPPLNPFWNPVVLEGKDPVFVRTDPLYSIAEGQWVATLGPFTTILARFFYLNWILFLFNILLVGFPLDGGRMLQAILWVYLGFRKATQYVVYSGYGVAALLATYCFVTMEGDDVPAKLVLFSLAVFIAATCSQQSKLLEAGILDDEGSLGYDFSQGYTSLERTEPRQPRPREPNFLQRWLQRRAERRRQKEEEERLAEEQRLDEILAKLQQHGKDALTPEERRFLERVSARYRSNRNRP